MIPQFESRSIYRARSSQLAAGITIFTIGLFKKVVIADRIALHATPVFDAALAGADIGLVEAWGGALAYTLQLYFDFSGYSDMAIGLVRMIGVRLPDNFNSPYKAVNIIEFWRRWHMTLSRFLREYVYFSLGGNRQGRPRRYANLLITMLLGGLWHGAAWTFVLWGGLHGAMLVLNHGWRALRSWCGHDVERSTRLGRAVSVALTFVAVVLGWVVFRAESFAAAQVMLGAMFGGSGLVLPEAFAGIWHETPTWLAFSGNGMGSFGAARGWFWISLLLGVVWLGPNSQELMRGFERSAAVWQPSSRWALLIGLLAASSLLHLVRVSEFLYFQF
jgi:D-alanyl-lipoteichoic acid acyltransferase DltB (MBOAT superfamily)